MDKNKCPNFENKNTLTEKKICLDKIFLSSQIKPFFLFFIMIFFEKNLKIKSVATLMETLGDKIQPKFSHLAKNIYVYAVNRIYADKVYGDTVKIVIIKTLFKTIILKILKLINFLLTIKMTLLFSYSNKMPN